MGEKKIYYMNVSSCSYWTVPVRKSEVVEGVQKFGVVEPLIARVRGEKFEVYLGLERLYAASIVGIKKVPVMVRDATDAEIKELRSYMCTVKQDFYYRAETVYRTYTSLCDGVMTTSDVARKFNISPATVERLIHIHKMDPTLKEILQERDYGISVVSTLAYLPTAVQAILCFYLADHDITLGNARKLRDYKHYIRDLNDIVHLLE